MVKISDEQFLSALRESAGLCTQTAKLIKKLYGIDYTRQAVHDRAKKHPDEVKDIKEQIKDRAENGLLSLFESENEQVRLKALELYLKTQARDRGYVQKQEFGLTDKDGNDMAITFIFNENA